MLNKIIFSFLILLGQGAHAAAVCESPGPVQNLHLTYPGTSALKNPVQVRFSIENEDLLADFSVTASVINAKKDLGPKEYPYQFDVVELFVSVDPSHFPYYEFELSPYGQSFEVRIESLKKPFIDNIHTGATYKAAKTTQGWKGQIRIPLKSLNWDGDVLHIAGNAYSVQGKSPGKTYWSLSLPVQSKPNFHQPQFFKPLFQCSQ